MKYIIVGLGKLGSALAQSFAEAGHDVIGVDHEMHQVEAVKNKISTAICLETRDENAVKTLPLKEADAVYVTFGEDIGISVHSVAILKQLGVRRLIVRSMSPLHETILKSIGVDEIITPERDFSVEYVASLELGNRLEHWYKITPNYHVVNIRVPRSLVGNKIQDIDFDSTFHLKLISVLRLKDKKNMVGMTSKRFSVLKDINEDSVFEENDVLVLFGKPEYYNKLKEV